MSEERKRLSRGEQIDLIDLMGIADRADYVLKHDSLRNRLKRTKRAKWRLASARSNLVRLVEDMLDTVPVDQLKHMQRNLKHVRVHVYVGNAVQQKDKLEGRWFNIEEMNTVASAVAQCCQMCPYDNAQDQNQCKFKKLMDCLPVDPDENTVGCGWFTRLGRE